MADRRRYSYPSSTSEIPHSSTHQSFSSTLLDAIYREIDRDASYRKKKPPLDDKIADPTINLNRLRKLKPNHSTSTSTDFTSISHGISSQPESLPIRRPKAVRIVADREIDPHHRQGLNSEHKSTAAAATKPESGGFLKTKSKALKIYGELKKVKQPISPGGKLAGFWNSLLSKKPKLSAVDDDSPSLKSSSSTTTITISSSTCSSSSSFSRSCLSKTTPSSSSSTSTSACSRSKSSAVSEKRSVRFFPVSVIVDEDCQPCGHKALRDVIVKSSSTTIDEDVKVRVTNRTRKIVDSVQSPPFHFHHRYTKSESIDRVFDEEVDGSSDSSSDLFELDDLDGSRYGQQLPVYGTTDFRTNRAITICKY